MLDSENLPDRAAEREADEGEPVDVEGVDESATTSAASSLVV